MPKASGSNARDFCFYWRFLYEEKTSRSYRINFMVDCGIMKRLMSQHSNRVLRQLIKFTFSDHSSTDFIRKEGYPIRLFPSQVSKFVAIMSSPGIEIATAELQLETPYYEDGRTSYIWSRVREGDLTVLIQNSTNSYYWDLLIEKLRRQKGFVPRKVLLFYELWKVKEDFERVGITHESRSSS